MNEKLTLDDMMALADLNQRAILDHDGHFTILKFTSNWRVELGLQTELEAPNPNDPYHHWSKGTTLNDAIRNCLAGIPGDICDLKTKEL